MTPDKLKIQGITLLQDVLAKNDMEGIFTVASDGLIDDELNPGVLSMKFTVKFNLGNVSHNHQVLISWKGGLGIGLDHGMDGKIQPITLGSVMAALYEDLVFSSLDEQYL